MILDESSCHRLAERHSADNPRVAWWLADLIASACRDGHVRTVPVGSIVVDELRHPVRAVAADEGLDGALERLSSYADLVEDLLPERMPELLALPYPIALHGSETFHAALDRLARGTDNVVPVAFGRR